MEKKQKKKEYIPPELQVHYIEMENDIGIHNMHLHHTIENPSVIINAHLDKGSKPMKKN